MEEIIFEDGKAILADCMEYLPCVESGIASMVLADLPYGVTKNDWDCVIPIEPLFEQYKRILTPSGVVVMTATMPFAASLIVNKSIPFRYDWIYKKKAPSGFLNCKRMPLRAHEMVLIFYNQLPTYNPQKTSGHERKTSKRRLSASTNYGHHSKLTDYDSTDRYPLSVQEFSTDKQKTRIHPTQKPVGLYEYLIKTYSNLGDLVVDNTGGGLTSAVAAVNTGRRFLVIEKERRYFFPGVDRIKKAYA